MDVIGSDSRALGGDAASQEPNRRCKHRLAPFVYARGSEQLNVHRRLTRASAESGLWPIDMRTEANLLLTGSRPTSAHATRSPDVRWSGVFGI